MGLEAQSCLEKGYRVQKTEAEHPFLDPVSGLPLSLTHPMAWSRFTGRASLHFLGKGTMFLIPSWTGVRNPANLFAVPTSTSCLQAVVSPQPCTTSDPDARRVSRWASLEATLGTGCYSEEYQPRRDHPPPHRL